MSTLGEALQAGTDALRAAVETPALARREAETLLCEASCCGRAQLYAWPERPLAPGAESRYLTLVERRAAGEPVAYLLERAGFMDFELEVSSDVLIPRPETELLVEHALNRLGAMAPTARVADLGTGSGAIAIALARAGYTVLATDLSEPALAMARANATRLAVPRLRFASGHWCEALGSERFDMLVSNPPYVADGDPHLGALRHEPRSALVAPNAGTGDLAYIAECATTHLAHGGWLLLEHGFEQGAWLRGALLDCDFTRVRTRRDYAGHERITEACWP